jgi:pyruvate,water dikinase
VEETLGHLPEDVHIEVIPLLTLSDFLTLLPANLKLERMMRNEIKKIPAFLAETPAWCEHMHQRIRSTQTRADLVSLWREELKPNVKHAFYALRGSMRQFDEHAARLRRELKQLVGDADANALLSHVSSDGELLASLGPVVGLASVAQGTMSREAYQKRYGHRGPDEFELARPRPAEDPHWLERQLAEWSRSPVNVEALLAKQQGAFDAARQRFQERYPRKAKAIHRRLEQFASDARMREAVRSETTRVVGVVRQFALRAGELTDLGNDIFFLSLDEMLDILEGLPSAADYIPARRETHAR